MKGECEHGGKVQKDSQTERINEFTMKEADRLREKHVLSGDEFYEWQSIKLRPTNLSDENLETSSRAFRGRIVQEKSIWQTVNDTAVAPE